MRNKNRSFVSGVLFVLLGCMVLMASVSGQDKVLDFYGEVSDDSPTGYVDYVEMGCWQCHGFQGQSTGGDGPKLAPGPIPYPAFELVVRRPPVVMPAYSPNVLSDEKLQRIYAYLQSIPAAPDVSDIPLLSRE